MITRVSRVIGTLLIVGAAGVGCSGAASSASISPSNQPPPQDSAEPSPTAALPVDFPIGSWTTTLTEADLRAGGVTGEGEIAENAGTFTLTMAADGTWTAAQVTSVPVRWPVFKGTWTATGPDGFTQVTTFPQDYAGDSVDFTWRIENGSLVLKVVNPPDPILPVVMESHPWQPAG
jgi:hypothetical protein